VEAVNQRANDCGILLQLQSNSLLLLYATATRWVRDVGGFSSHAARARDGDRGSRDPTIWTRMPTLPRKTEEEIYMCSLSGYASAGLVNWPGLVGLDQSRSASLRPNQGQNWAMQLNDTLTSHVWQLLLLPGHRDHILV
jgi:hypothetical protein